MALKPWPKGVSGNPAGRRRKPMIDKMLEEALIANDSAKAKAIADRLVSLAARGSIAAAKLIAERVEGRPSRNMAEEKSEATLSPEQVRMRLQELLTSGDVKDLVSTILFPTGEEKPIQ